MKPFAKIGVFLAASSFAHAAFAQTSATFPQAVVQDHCYNIADERSKRAADQVSDYDVDDVGSMFGSGLALSIQRKKLRKQIYLRCMSANGFNDVKFAKPRKI